MTEEDPGRVSMGTAEEANEALADVARQWRALRQPLIAPVREHKRVEAAERELRFQVCNAALFWLWHVENPQ